MVFHSMTGAVQYISGAVIQLVALPLIMVGQRVMDRKADRRAEKDHISIMAQLEIVKIMLENQNRHDRVLQSILERLPEKIADVYCGDDHE